MLQRDPDNRLLARGPRTRLAAEVIRDQALFIAGLLVEKLGGESARPYQPAGLWNDMVFKEIRYAQDHGENLYRRSLYTYWKRTIAPPEMVTFDAATRESCAVREARTNTPLQALNLMNDVVYVETARILAERMMREGGASADERLRFAFRRPRRGQPERGGASGAARELAGAVRILRQASGGGGEIIEGRREARRRDVESDRTGGVCDGGESDSESG